MLEASPPLHPASSRAQTQTQLSSLWPLLKSPIIWNKEVTIFIFALGPHTLPAGPERHVGKGVATCFLSPSVGHTAIPQCPVHTYTPTRRHTLCIQRPHQTTICLLKYLKLKSSGRQLCCPTKQSDALSFRQLVLSCGELNSKFPSEVGTEKARKRRRVSARPQPQQAGTPSQEMPSAGFTRPSIARGSAGKPLTTANSSLPYPHASH